MREWRDSVTHNSLLGICSTPARSLAPAPFESRSASAMKKTGMKPIFFLAARVAGLEPVTSPVHIPPNFHKGMDYIFTISFRS